MKKLVRTLLLLFVITLSIKVDAYNYVNKGDYNFENWKEKYLEIGGVNPKIKDVRFDSEGNYLFLVTYKETGNGIPTSEGTTNPERDHSRLVKVDKDFNKIFDSNFYFLLREGGDTVAKTVATTYHDVTQLANGDYVVSGTVWGFSGGTYEGITYENNTKIAVRDDGMEAFFLIYDKNGNKKYYKIYHDEGLKHANVVASLKDGGFVIKYMTIPYRNNDGTYEQPKEFNTSSKMEYWFAVYDSNYKVIDSFSATESSKLNNYSFINIDDLNRLKYYEERKYITDEIDDWYNYIGVDISGNPNYYYPGKAANAYANTGVNIGHKKIKFNKNFPNIKELDENGPFIFFNDDSMLIGDHIIDSEGKILTQIENKNKIKQTFVNPDGTIIGTASENTASSVKIFYNKPSKDQKMNFIINGKKVETNLGTFIENDRTYINLNQLCGIMGCTYSKDESTNKITLKFSFLRDNKQLPALFNDPNNEIYNQSWSIGDDGANYIIEHVVGTKTYNAYLEIGKWITFALKSPTFNRDGVDVTSLNRNGQIYVPLRFVSEALGRYVEYQPPGEDGKATVIISSQGEGEFYEKYEVGIGTKNLSLNSTFSNPVSEKFTLTGTNTRLYAYGIEKSTKKIINIDNTVFYPWQGRIWKQSSIEPMKESFSNVGYDGFLSYYEGELDFQRNYLYRNKEVVYEQKYDTLPKKVIVLAISNLEGYPFLNGIVVD